MRISSISWLQGKQQKHAKNNNLNFWNTWNIELSDVLHKHILHHQKQTYRYARKYSFLNIFYHCKNYKNSL